MLYILKGATMAIETLRGKRKVFEETYKSLPEFSDQYEALDELNRIRHSYPSSRGWVEIAGYVEPLPNSKWRAVRHHARYE